MRSHTGAVMSLGKGAVYGMSSKQKLNTKSSCEAELVGVDDAIPKVLWTQQFLKEQSIEVTDNVVYQDNQSAILLEKNGTRSSGKRTRHLGIRYFFITDKRFESSIVLRRSSEQSCWGENIETGCLVNISGSNQVIESQECVKARLAREQGLTPSRNDFDSDEDDVWTAVVSKRVKRVKRSMK
jgi:hypothetical protein